jgi:2-polyprenyl-3-methyl-5-hydroxy-6-metoxy-1,4-benzoquinol methylase/glycosyltransferase involved in cell wall biosynthesis
MELVIHSMGMPFNGDTIKKRSLGGSESAAYYLALEMARRGHRVSVFTNEQKEGAFDGVQYCWAGPASQQHPMGEKFEFYATSTPHDVLLVQRHPMGFHKRWASKVCVHQMHDLALHRNGPMLAEGSWQVGAFTCVSEWHKKQFLGVHGFNPDSVRVVRNGVDPALYANRTDLVAKGEKAGFYVDKEGKPGIVIAATEFNMLYQSRPERGLEHLVRPGGIMAQLAKSAPNARLFVCGYDNTVDQMRAFYESLYEQARALPNVTLLGALDKAALAQLQMSLDLLIYPSEFEEVSCITAMEAMHAGLPMLASDVGALSETCEGSGVTLLPLAGGKADEKAFVRWVEKRTKSSPTDEWWAKKSARQLESAKTRGWANAADEFESVVDDLFARRKTTANMLRHLLDHSDVSAFDEYRKDHKNSKGEVWGDDDIAHAAQQERAKLYGFIEDPAAYAEHYAFHQKKYYDSNPALATQGEDCTGTSRFRGAHQFVDEAVQLFQVSEDKRQQEHEKKIEVYQDALAAADASPPVVDFEELEDPGQFIPRRMRVLDFGCAHGHYTIPLASMFQNVEFVGMDISPQAINAAERWRTREKLENANFAIGTQADISELVGEFDLIIAAEIVEHVWDYKNLLQKLATKLAVDGSFLLTTPCGRWEWNGIEGESYWGGREHVHHFEYFDLRDLFGKEAQLCYAPAGQDASGGQLGSWITFWKPERVPDVVNDQLVSIGKPVKIGKIDYARKFKYTAPRQTVSACMIVKDGEDTLRRCVSTFVRAVDELIIAIDPTTTDRTSEVIERLQEEFWYRPIRAVKGLKALDVDTGGFAAARNRSMEPACGDWRFWCDADEELRPAFGLWKHLRNSGINGVGMPQVHYSAFPAQVLTIDMPTRLFRGDIEAEFFGYVHEHPETKMGVGIEHALVRGDAQLLHAGYVDEPTRRKRFTRNYPLIVKDLQENPTRRLNKFLYLRDLAQGAMFQLERSGFMLVPGQREQALQGIKLYEEIVDWNVPRMIIEGCQYYSLCVEMAYGGFDAEIKMRTQKPDAPALGQDLEIKGRWHSREFYFHVIRKLQEETTKFYESPYA